MGAQPSFAKGEDANSSVNYKSDAINSLNEVNFNAGTEVFNSIRFTRYNNPLINYSYKSGHYLGI